MNQEHGTNYEDRIELLIALMTKDYEKARDIGNRLLNRNRDDADVIRALNILNHKKYRECERSNLIESKPEGSVATDGDDTDFTDVNVDIRIDPEMTNKISSYDMSRSNEAKIHPDLKQKMHRVIQIKANKNVTQIKNLTKH